jgi:hypothetical protein
MQVYSDQSREQDEHALPNVEVWQVKWELWNGDAPVQLADDPREFLGMRGVLELDNSPGWYWQACFPGCLPDGEASGPFGTEQEALADAQAGEEA